MRIRSFSAAVGSVITGVVGQAGAQPILTSFNPIEVDPAPAFFLGYQFVLSEEVTIGGLGAYDHDGCGLAVVHRVALYDSSGVQLALVSVDGTGDALVGQFRYASLAPMLLPAGTYFVMADVIAPDAYVFEADAIVTDPRVTYTASYFSSDNTPSGAFKAAGPREYMSANVHIDPLPTVNCLGDADNDGDIDFGDITTTLARWGQPCR